MSDQTLTVFSVSGQHSQSVLKPHFVASTSAFVKVNGADLLLVGQSNAPARVEFCAQPLSMAVRLPIGFQTLFLKEPASEITNDTRPLVLPEMPPFDAELPFDILLHRIKQLIVSKSLLDKDFALVEEMIKTTLRRPDSTISELSGVCGYSARHLQRIFLRYTGFSTKEFLEILRFERSMAQKQANGLQRPGGAVEPRTGTTTNRTTSRTSSASLAKPQDSSPGRCPIPTIPEPREPS